MIPSSLVTQVRFFLRFSASSRDVSISMSLLKFSLLIGSCLNMEIGYAKLELNTVYKDDRIIFLEFFLLAGNLAASSES